MIISAPHFLTCGTLVASAFIAALSPAHADVSWHHRIAVRSGKVKKPLFTAAMFNDWNARQHRTLVKFSSQNLPPMPFDFPGTAPTVEALSALSGVPIQNSPKRSRPSATVDVGFVYDLDADRYISYSSPTGQYYSEAYRPLLKRLRFDPWRKVAPELSRGQTPSLTPEQRARLGAETRAVYSGWLKQMVKIYFRPSTEKRTINGMEGRGYRMTWLVNTGTPKAAQWAKVKFEWWLGGEASGDEEIRTFQRENLALMKSVGWPSTSMWLNEMPAIWWQMMPVELHRAAATLIPPTGSMRAGFNGTPLQMYMTIEPPPLQRSMMGGNFHVDIELVSRNTYPLPERVFRAPAAYKKVSLEPQLKAYDIYMNKLSELLSGKIPDMSDLPDLTPPGSGNANMPEL